jgi:hypothetical protein
MTRNRQFYELWKGAVAGFIGGLVGSWAMNQFQIAWAKLSEGSKAEHREQHEQPSESDEDATMRMANQLLRPVIGRELTKREKKIGGPIVHYAFGASMGAVYGTIAELTPLVRAGAGTGFGSVLFIGADEIAVPLAGLSGPPNKTPLKLHAYAWASHLVYGLATEMTRWGVREMLRNESAWREPEMRSRSDVRERRRMERRAA